ncbi:MAG TPA: cytochrome c [Ignavibacteriales bacterium]|nr:cytochrome c [Ignavibacteriales bacterium]
MSKSQIWIASFLGLFLILFLFSRIFKDDASEAELKNEQVNEGTAAQTEDPVEALRRNGCMGCHGPALEGTNLAPALTGIKEYWNSREELISYLRNPNSFMDKDRFQNYKSKYNSVMPGYGNLDIKELGRIADYLLSLK